MKAAIRGLYIREISKRKPKTQEFALQNRVSTTEGAFVDDPSADAKADWEEAQ